MIESIPMGALWAGFATLVIVMLALDLFVFHRKSHEVKFKEALGWSAFWIGLAALFGVFVYARFGSTKAIEYTTAYLLEKALSVDNLFVFLVAFSYFRVPAELQHRVLFWGVMGALVLRAVFIFLGVAIVTKFAWVLYLFGVLLIYTGFKLLKGGEEQPEPEKNPILKLFRRVVPMVNDYHGNAFTVVKDGVRHATPLLLVLVVVEASDIMFAVDSIPAVFGVSHDPFIIYTSNILAILGLRSLFFVIAGAMNKFHYLKVGLGLVLAFIGVKMLLPLFGAHVKIEWSLAVIVVLLGGSMAWSIIKPPKVEHRNPSN